MRFWEKLKTERKLLRAQRYLNKQVAKLRWRAYITRDPKLEQEIRDIEEAAFIVWALHWKVYSED